MSTMTLYDVAFEGQLIASILEDSEGELTPELEERLDALMKQGPERIEAAAMVVRSLFAHADICSEEADRYEKRAAALEANARKLLERMTIALDSAFGGKVKTPRVTVWAQSSAPTTSFRLADDTTIEAFESKWPEFVRVTKDIDRSGLARAKKFVGVPEGIVAEEKPGTRYTRIK